MLSVQTGISPAAARRQRKRLLRDLEADERRRHARAMADLAKQEKAERKARREELKKAKGRCRAGVKGARERADTAYRRAREAAWKAAQDAKEKRIAEKRATKQAARDVCELDRRHVEDTAAEKIGHVQRRIEENRRFKQEMDAIKRANKDRDKSRKKATRGERLAEADDAVVADIPVALIPLWNRVKKTIKGSDRMSRTEAFLHYAAENPAEVYEAQEAVAAREMKRLERENRAQSRSTKANGKPRRSRRAELRDVPF